LTDPAEASDALDRPGVGGKAIRGGLIRVGGYGAGVVLALISAPLLLRHLGVEDFGGYVAVTSLITVVALVADLGMTVLAVREYAVEDRAGRLRLVGLVVWIRIVVAVIGGALAVGFAAAAGYDEALIAGVALAAVGMVIALVQQSFTIPLVADLRMGTVTALDLVSKVLVVVGMVALVLLGAGVTAFLALSIPVGLVVAAATIVAARGSLGGRVRLSGAGARKMIRQTLPFAAGSMLANLFYRVPILMMSVISTAKETGYFSASFRVIDVVLPIPSLITATAFPILARAAAGDEARLGYALQRLCEIGLLLGGLVILGFLVGAEPIIDFLGGEAFAPSIPVLRIQGAAIAATFLFAVWAAGLWAIHAQRSIVVASLVGLVCVSALTALLVPPHGAIGAAVAMTVSEVVLAATAGILLTRRRPSLRPRLFIALKVGVAVGCGLVPWALGVPDLAATVLGVLVYAGVVLLLRAVPRDVFDALRSRGEPV